jgi:molybdopterin/thiamine biosynthesis adenylyltransferase
MSGAHSQSEQTRYERQMVLPEVGAQGQSRIAAASVLVVGAGGLGCPVLQYLCAAGVGHLLIVDPDRIELTNLHRQPLYTTRECGQLKAIAARGALLEANPEISVEAICERLTPANAPGWVAQADIIVDAADSFAVTYTLSDECQRAGKPLVSASVIGLTGYAGVFCGGAPSYRAVFPDVPSQVGSCAESGVLGTAPGLLGVFQAQLVLSWLLRLEPSVLGRMLTVDLRQLRFSGFAFTAAPEPAAAIPFIAPTDVRESDRVIDVRKESVDALKPSVGTQQPPPRIVLCCRSGLRAWRAAKQLQAKGYHNLALLALGDA